MLGVEMLPLSQCCRGRWVSAFKDSEILPPAQCEMTDNQLLSYKEKENWILIYDLAQIDSPYRVLISLTVWDHMSHKRIVIFLGELDFYACEE